MLDIVLVDSVDFTESEYEIQLGLLSIATVLKNSNYKVNIVNFDYLIQQEIITRSETFEKMIELFSRYIINMGSRIVGFYTICNSYHITLALSKKIKEYDSNIKIVLGGPQATLTAEQTITKCEWIDAIGIGEGERTIVNIVRYLLEQQIDLPLKGVIYREKNNIIKTCMEELIYDLDNIPLLDYSLVDIINNKSIPIDVGRGCPFTCKYCSTKKFWKRTFRLKTNKRLIDEIKYIIKNFNDIKFFEFEHDLFTANRWKIIDFCNALIKEELNIEWGCSARFDTLDKEVIEKLYLAGCRKIYLGVESGSERIQKIISKKLNLEMVVNIAKELSNYNIKSIASFMYGFPEETLEDIEETITMIINLMEVGISNIQMHSFSVLPGTEYYEALKDSLEFMETNKNLFLDLGFPYFQDYSVREMVKTNLELFPQYYSFVSPIREKIDFLDVYIYNFLSLFIKGYRTTYKLAKDYIGTDVGIFIKFKEINMNYFSSYIKTNEMLRKPSLASRQKIIGNFVEKSDFGQNKRLIKNMFLLENNAINLMLKSVHI